MSNWCLIEDGKITRMPGPLPRNWRKVSGLDVLSQKQLADLGWVPVEDVKDDYDPETHQLGYPVHEIGDGVVRRVWRAEALPERSVAEKREQAYEADGLTDHALIVALWEKVVENRPEAADAIQAKRLAIKAKLPKE